MSQVQFHWRYHLFSLPYVNLYCQHCQLSTSAETRMWGRRLAAMLAVYTGRGVAPEVNLRERISHMPPQSSNKAEPTLALKPRGDVTRSPKQGYQWPHKWTCVQQKFLKKKKKNFLQLWENSNVWVLCVSRWRDFMLRFVQHRHIFIFDQ